MFSFFFNFQRNGRAGDCGSAVSFRNEKIPARSLIFFALSGRKLAKPRLSKDFRRKGRKSLLNPWFGRKFADFGPNPIDQAAFRKNSLLNSLLQGIQLKRIRSTASVSITTTTARSRFAGYPRARGNALLNITKDLRQFVCLLGSLADADYTLGNYRLHSSPIHEVEGSCCSQLVTKECPRGGFRL
jgi:hypothetical protein